MTVSAIIPAFNEENTIARVIYTLKKVQRVDEIIVVSDGSVDGTASVARSCGVDVIELPQNRGKGAAVKRGLDKCKGDIALLVDADLIGLKEKHIEDLLEPVINGSADMSVGVFSNGRVSTDLAQKISPYLSGQRAVKKSILDRIGNIECTGYGIEIALTKFAEKEKINIHEVELNDLTHVMKEEKLGFVRGFIERMKMYWQILKGLKAAGR